MKNASIQSSEYGSALANDSPSQMASVHTMQTNQKGNLQPNKNKINNNNGNNKKGEGNQNNKPNNSVRMGKKNHKKVIFPCKFCK